MSIYCLNLCKEEEKSQLIDFIRDYWQKDHIFTKSDEMLRFQHYNCINKEFNFVLAHNTQTGEIDGVIGLIPLSQYDPDLAEFNETWGGIWKVRPDVKNNEIDMLGLLLFDAFKKYNSHCSIGMSEIAKKFHRIKKYTMGVMNQYYLLNSDFKEFKIASIPSRHDKKNTVENNSDYSLKFIQDIATVSEGVVTSVYRPQKSLTFLLNRYQRHPIYKYLFWGVYDKRDTLATILVTRKIEVSGSKVIRIVDVFGSLEGLGSLKREFLDILREESAEYIDIMNYGIHPQVFEGLGFELLDPLGEIIIPNYFEPFLRKNIVLDCAYKSPDNYVIFKADSDQDRPSTI
jgi:hypothetical protein